MRRKALAAGWTGFVLLACGASAAAAEGPVPSVFRGKVVVSDVLIAPASQFQSSEVMLAALRRFERPSVDGHDGYWRFHFVAFLDLPAAAASMRSYRMVATDVTDSKHRREVKVFEMTGQPETQELRVNDFVVTGAMGFEHGHKYELTVMAGDDDAPGARKQDVYDRGVVTLR